jgi:5-methylcytosine-specific restriction endonuclease McrA
MEHLSLLARLLLIERGDGPTETKDAQVAALIEATQDDSGIGNESFENALEARAVLRTLNLLYEVFKDDPILDDQNGLKELRIEYFVISVYLLARHLSRFYVFDETEKRLFREFILYFHERWKTKRETDTDILLFADNRQQSKHETEARDRIIRQLFFEYATECGHTMLTKDERRAFSEAERIRIYRDANGMCQICIDEGKPERECQVSWSEFQADHVIPHSKGGRTALDNAQLLCSVHNQRKGASLS